MSTPIKVLATLRCKRCVSEGEDEKVTIAIVQHDDDTTHLHIVCDTHGGMYKTPVTLDATDVCGICGGELGTHDHTTAH